MTDLREDDGRGGLRCAVAARERVEPVWGTAVVASRWLLIEEPGPWGPDGLTNSRITTAVARELADRARRHGVRVQLIRRHTNRHADTATRRWALADTRPGQEAMHWGTVDTDADLLDIPLDMPLTAGAGAAWEDATYLVCTHGRRDACCAMRGRPVVGLLAAHRPEHTWETSHLGGHRFASTMVVLPHGLCYGYLDPQIAVDVAKVHETGHLVPRHLRGRSCYEVPVQAAQHFAREALGDTRVDALPLVASHQLDDATWRVELDATGGPVVVTVRRTLLSSARLSCAATEESQVRSFRLLSLTSG